MQPKWFRRYDVAAEHNHEAGDQHEQLKREQICHQWQLEEMDGNDGPDAAGMATCHDGRRVAETVERLAAVKPRIEDTATLFRRNVDGREFRRRAGAGDLTNMASAECLGAFMLCLSTFHRHSVRAPGFPFTLRTACI